MANQEQAQKFFDLCETGKGWDACAPFCTAEASFRCDVLPMKTLQDYTNWMKSIVEGVTPDCSYKVFSLTKNENQVAFSATFFGTHLKDNGPGNFSFSKQK